MLSTPDHTGQYGPGGSRNGLEKAGKRYSQVSCFLTRGTQPSPHTACLFRCRKRAAGESVCTRHGQSELPSQHWKYLPSVSILPQLTRGLLARTTASEDRTGDVIAECDGHHRTDTQRTDKERRGGLWSDPCSASPSCVYATVSAVCAIRTS